MQLSSGSVRAQLQLSSGSVGDQLELSCHWLEPSQLRRNKIKDITLLKIKAGAPARLVDLGSDGRS